LFERWTRMKIETERLIIRSLQQADVPALAELWSDADVTRYLGGPREFEEVSKNLMEDVRSMQPTFDLWPVAEKETGRIIGHFGILDKDIEGRTEYEIVYVLAKPEWGKGYATEAAAAIKEYAFQELGLKRVIALIEPGNIQSEKVAHRIGLEYERDVLRPGSRTMKLFAASSV
jgi:ribosomal-protein-alanine N-acetyltransferase